MYKKITVFVLITLLTLSLPFSVLADGKNLLKNSSFEEEKDGLPIDWLSEAWNKEAGATEFKVETDGAYSGSKYVTITNNVENDSRFLQAVDVKAGKKYKLSCWIKTENVGTSGKGANLSIGSQLVTTNEIKGTNGKWEYAEMYAVIGKGISTMNITIGVGGYGSINTGKASFDDVKLEEVNDIPAGAITTNIQRPDNSSGDNNNDNQNSSGQKEKGGISFVVWAILAVAIIIVVFAAYTTFKSSTSASDEIADESEEDIDYAEESEDGDMLPDGNEDSINCVDAETEDSKERP